MSRDESIGNRTDVIEIDIETRDIHRIWSQVPSEYVVGKKYLTEARAILYKDQKKALKQLKKARQEFINESVIATEYNQIRERIRFCNDDSVSKMEKRYHEDLAVGDYDSARKMVRKLAERTRGLEHPITVMKLSSDADNVSLKVSNSSDRSIVVILVRGTVNGERVVFDKPSFTVQPFGEVIVNCPVSEGGHPLEVVVEYRDGSDERSVSVTVSLG